MAIGARLRPATGTEKPEVARAIQAQWIAASEILHHLVGGDLTESGVQWSAEVSTVLANTDYTAFSLVLDNGLTGDIQELLPGLTLALKAGSTTADPKYKWQARIMNAATWIDLHGYITKADIGTNYVECSVGGYVLAGKANLDKYPIEVRLVIQSNEASPGVATAKIKNSSYVGVELK